jgi:hypothetical protein
VTLLPNGRWEIDASPMAAVRSKAKRAMGEMRSLAISCEAYAVDMNRYPKAATLDELARLVEPTYIKGMPRLDPWGKPYVYATWGKESHYRVVSGGADGVIDGASLAMTDKDPQRANGSHKNDLVFVDGEFRRYPDEKTQP